MAKASQISCPLCLGAFEPQDLIRVDLPEHAFLKDAWVGLCRECCAAVLEACARRHEAAAPSATIEGAASDEPEHDQQSNDQAEFHGKPNVAD